MAIRRGGNALWSVLPWYGAFIVINSMRAALLAYQRHLWRFTPEEAALHASAFPMLAREAAKRLMAAGVWETLPPGSLLTREGEVAPKVWLVATGQVTVTLGGEPITYLYPGQFVGEIGFVAQQPASATAIATAGADGAAPRFLSWESHELRRRLKRDGALRSTFESAFGTDLARKIADQNVRVRREAGNALSGLDV